MRCLTGRFGFAGENDVPCTDGGDVQYSTVRLLPHTVVISSCHRFDTSMREDYRRIVSTVQYSMSVTA
jgi:hypothetical protein